MGSLPANIISPIFQRAVWGICLWSRVKWGKHMHFGESDTQCCLVCYGRVNKVSNAVKVNRIILYVAHGGRVIF